MSAQYYYLVSSFPELSIDDKKTSFTYDSFLADCSAVLSPEDYQTLKHIRTVIDHKNIAAILNGSTSVFDTSGNYTQEYLSEELKVPDALPVYIQDFIVQHKEGKPPFPGYTVEDQLNRLFLDSVKELKEGFVSQWFAFESSLRNILAALNVRYLHEHAADDDIPVTLESGILGDDDITEFLKKSNAPDFALSGLVPWIEKIIRFDRSDIAGFELFIDKLRWEMAEELGLFSYFSLEAVLVYSIKLSIVLRWKKMDAEAGKEIFINLSNALLSGFEIPGQT
jgi:hypothetical protein